MNHIISFFKKNYIWIIVIVCLIGTIAIVEDVFKKEIMRCDTIAYNFFVTTIRSNALTPIIKIITNFGSASILLGICIISFIFIKNKKIPVAITSNLVIIAILNQIVKYIIQRPRPEGYRLINEVGFSFPSGHSMVSMAFYGFLIYLIMKYIKNKSIKYILSFFLGLLILLIGCSRIYLGVHYASDVIAGGLISLVYLILIIKFYNKCKCIRKYKDNT